MNLLVIFIVVLKFIRTLNDLENSSLLFSNVLFGITTSLALIMLFYEKKCLIRTSAPLSLFWPLLTIFYLPTMKLEIEIFQEDYFGATSQNNTILIKAHNYLDYVNFGLSSSFFVLCFLLSVMNFWPDTKDLVPLRKNIAPNNQNSFFSSVFLSWMDPIIWKGFKRPLKQNDLFTLPSKVDVNENVKIFQKEWEDYLKRNNIKFSIRNSNTEKKKIAKFWIPLFKSLRGTFMLGTILAFIHYNLAFLGPQVKYFFKGKGRLFFLITYMRICLPCPFELGLNHFCSMLIDSQIIDFTCGRSKCSALERIYFISISIDDIFHIYNVHEFIFDT